ncbi:MAG: hypothetical protein ABSA12_04350 [Verrucomicrobiia bacterium]|jgi:hypothetical protein
MDREQAKEILLGYQPGSDDAVDPQIAEALRLAESDPELAVWFEQQQRADAMIRTGLRDMPVPSDLKERILGERQIVRVDFGWRRLVLAAAAVVIVVLGLARYRTFRQTSRYGLGTYQMTMVRYVTGPYPMVAQARSFDELRQVLAQKGWPTDFIVPDTLRNVTVVGGGALEWHGHKVDLACMRESGRGLWLFVVDNAALPNPPATTTPRVQMVDAVTTAVWSQDGKTYLFTAQGDEAYLRKYLP